MQIELKLPHRSVQGLASIAAVMENRAQEVGVAVFTPELNLMTIT